MKKLMMRFLNMMLCVALVLSMAVSAMAADVTVTYDGVTRDFRLDAGSEELVTDLFPSFTNVMPGDTLAASVKVKNDASNKVKIYLRAKDASENRDFLNQLQLTVTQDDTAVLYDGPAGETGTLTDWVCLGTFYSDTEVNLDVKLHVPIELDNEFQNIKTELQWEFKADDFVDEASDSDVPKTGDQSNLIPALLVLAVSLLAMVVLLIALVRKRKKEEDQ